MCKTRRLQNDARTAAIRTFANAMALAECGLLQNMAVSFQNNEDHLPEPPPSAFGEALGIIDGVAMYNDAKNVVANELHKDAGGPNLIIEAIKEDAQQAGGDKDYAIDIGV